ncbi:MAG: TetR/AcrR family transcriptional regulator [Nocardioides sp.]|uniref:TetR/AcrR family transcriptional regulator n=1 Tax=Nocardioides sp. TaxID=35761 RepID=UPI003D6C117B
MEREATQARGRPRQASTDEQITRAATEILRELGPQAVNVASVAARSGVARTTIYRRHRDRRELLTAALRPVADKGEAPEHLTIVQRLDWVLASTEEVLQRAIGPGGVAAVLTDADPEFSAALRAALASALRPVLAQVEGDLDRGALTAEVEPDLVLSMILGVYLAETLRRGVPDETWRTRTSAALGRLLGASATP